MLRWKKENEKMENEKTENEKIIKSIDDEDLEKVSGGSSDGLYHYKVCVSTVYLPMFEFSRPKSELVDRLVNGDKVISYDSPGRGVESTDWDGTPCRKAYVGNKNNIWGWVNMNGLIFDYVS